MPWEGRFAHLCLATDESYRQIALSRGKKNPDQVYVVRSGPDLRRMKIHHKTGNPARLLAGRTGQ